MLFLEVADFVGEHRFEFRPGELLDQRVEEDDFPISSEAGEERVLVTRAFAAVHDLEVSGVKIRPASQREQAFAQTAFGQRCEFVE